METNYREYKYRPYKAPPYVDPVTKKYEPYKPKLYKPPPYQDPLTRKYEPYKPSHIGNPHIYTPYRPEHVGIYGERQRERRIKTQQKSKPMKRTITSKPRPQRVTYKCYRNPTGPDIKLGPMGPDYKVHTYAYKPYKPPSLLNYHRVYKDPLRDKPRGYKEPTKLSEPTYGYKLTEENYIPFRSWRVGEINDTVSAGPPPTSKGKYQPREKTPVLIPLKSPPPASPDSSPVPTKMHVMTQTTPLPYIAPTPIPYAPVPMVTKHRQKTPDVPTPHSNTPPLAEQSNITTSSPVSPMAIPLVAAAPPVYLGAERAMAPTE